MGENYHNAARLQCAAVQQKPWLPLALLMAAFAAAVAIVDPRGNFPLNDDWDFALVTWNFLHTGRIEYTAFTVASAQTQALWGAAWSALFGETFAVLRMSIVTLSAATGVLLFTTLRAAGATNAIATFGAASLLFHPLFFWSANTYMTHVPFVFLSVAAAALLLRALRDERGVWLAAAVVVAIASCFSRQFGVLNLATPFVLAIVMRDELSPRWRRIAIAYAGAGALVAILLASGTLIASRQELPVHSPFGGECKIRLLLSAHHVFFQWEFAALFFLPALLLALFARPRLSRVGLGLAAVAFGILAWRMVSIGLPLPYRGGHVFVNFGLGPYTLRDVATLRMPPPHPIAMPWRLALSAIAFLAAVLLVAMVVRALRNSSILVRFAAIYLLLGTMVVALIRVFFDRYTLDTAWPLALLLPLLAAEARPRARAIAIAALVLIAIFGVGATAEYHAWNRARWEAYAYLRANGVTLAQMDGGYEINAIQAVRAGRANLGKRGFGVVDDRFILTFHEVPGYTKVRAFPYRRWFGLGRGEVLALQRAD